MRDGFEPAMPDGCQRVRRAAEIEVCFRGIASALARHSASGQAEGVILLERILSLLVDDPAGRRSANAGALEAAAELMRREPFNRIGLREIAEQRRMSYDHFRQLFREQLGVTPHAWRLRCRMQSAAALLLDQSVSIKEIAARAGYLDPAQFSRAFRHVIGVSPSVYRAITG